MEQKPLVLRGKRHNGNDRPGIQVLILRIDQKIMISVARSQHEIQIVLFDEITVSREGLFLGFFSAGALKAYVSVKTGDFPVQNTERHFGIVIIEECAVK